MTKYLVKSVSRATEENHNFAGKKVSAIYGKADKQLKYEGEGCWNDFDVLTAPMVREHGYNRKQDAKRSWIFRNPENTKFWQTEVEIIAYEC